MDDDLGFGWGGNTQGHHAPNRRADLERDVQNLVDPIVNIAELSDADLYGLRDEFHRLSRDVGKNLLEDDAE